MVSSVLTTDTTTSGLDLLYHEFSTPVWSPKTTSPSPELHSSTTPSVQLVTNLNWEISFLSNRWPRIAPTKASIHSLKGLQHCGSQTWRGLVVLTARTTVHSVFLGSMLNRN